MDYRAIVMSSGSIDNDYRKPLYMNPHTGVLYTYVNGRLQEYGVFSIDFIRESEKYSRAYTIQSPCGTVMSNPYNTALQVEYTIPAGDVCDLQAQAKAVLSAANENYDEVNGGLFDEIKIYLKTGLDYGSDSRNYSADVAQRIQFNADDTVSSLKSELLGRNEECFKEMLIKIGKCSNA